MAVRPVDARRRRNTLWLRGGRMSRFALIVCTTLSSGAALATSLWVHDAVERTHRPPTFLPPTAYFNTLLGQRPFYDDFELSPERIAGSEALQQFCDGLARRLRPVLSNASSHYDVWSYGFRNKAGGWPFVSRPLATPVFVEEYTEQGEFSQQ